MTNLPIEPQLISAKIEAELAAVSDARLVKIIEDLLVKPEPVDRLWHYGSEGQRYTCWTVLKDQSLGIAFCESGFGPSNPWGFVQLGGDDQNKSIGPDYEWYPTFMLAVREFMDLPEGDI